MKSTTTLYETSFSYWLDDFLFFCEIIENLIIQKMIWWVFLVSRIRIRKSNNNLQTRFHKTIYPKLATIQCTKNSLFFFLQQHFLALQKSGWCSHEKLSNLDICWGRKMYQAALYQLFKLGLLLSEMLMLNRALKIGGRE